MQSTCAIPLTGAMKNTKGEIVYLMAIIATSISGKLSHIAVVYYDSVGNIHTCSKDDVRIV